MMRSLRTIVFLVALCAVSINAAQQQNVNNQLVNMLLDLLKRPNMLSYNTPASNNYRLQTLSAGTGYSAPSLVSVQPAYGNNQQQTSVQSVAPIVPIQSATNGYGSSQQISADQVDPCNPSPCQNEGVCNVVNGNSFSCTCPWGWAGSRCEICVTDCASNPCTGNKKCLARFGGGYDCVCPANRKGPNCEYDNDACDMNRCMNNGVCKLELNGGYSCVCQPPYDGQNCESSWNNPCSNEVLRSSKIIQFRNPYNKNSYLICHDVGKYHTMSCPAGTFFNARLSHCVPEGYDPPVCPDQYCSNEGECVIDDQNKFKCACKRGFGGDRCEINIDECAYGGNQACGAGVCVDQIYGYYCRCPNGGIGPDCQNTLSNPCTEENLNNERNYHEFPSLKGDAYIHCTGVGQLIVARCPEGLFWNQDEQTCAVEKPVKRLRGGICDTLPCRNGATCNELSPTTFECVCKVGYTGDRCETLINYCESNPCSNGGRCLQYAGGYTCVCPDRVVDECCCHGVTNPCPPKAKLVPGVNNYFPHLFQHRYIHCDFEGRAFVRNCAPGLKWYQDALACLSDSHVKTFLASQQQPGLSYGTVPPPQIVAQPSNYATVPVISTTNYDSKPAPVIAPAMDNVQPSYGSSQQPALDVPKAQPSYGPAQQPALDIPKAQPSYGSAQQPALDIPKAQPSYGSAQQPALDIPKAQPAYGASQQPALDIPKAQPSYGSSYGSSQPAMDIPKQSSSYESTQPQQQQQQQSSSNNLQQPQISPAIEAQIMAIAQQMKMTPQQVMQLFQLGTATTQTTERTVSDRRNQNEQVSTQTQSRNVIAFTPNNGANQFQPIVDNNSITKLSNNRQSVNSFGRINY